jgi:ribosomal-protein-alanine N-acetyltransferase
MLQSVNAGLPDEYVIEPMTQTEAEAVGRWHYPPPYDFYDVVADPADYAELTDSVARGSRFFVASSPADRLVGFFEYKPVRDGVVEIGLGLRPDMTGAGHGLAFVNAGLAFAATRYSSPEIRLWVATFNQRAVKVYERAGFVPMRHEARHLIGAAWDFLEMLLVTEDDRPHG